MTLTTWLKRGAAAAALLVLPVGAAVAQETQSGAQSPETAQQGMTTGQAGQGGAQGQDDALIATVGGAEIRGSDVMTVLGMLPPQLQSQPPEMLVPMAVQQLILRELILEEARAQNLADDPEVIALVESSSEAARDDAMVKVWIDRELAGAVTPEAVQTVYADLQAQGVENLPPIDELRPRIEQSLQQQAMQEIQDRLQEGADVVFYDPSGQPVRQQDGAAGQTEGGTSGSTGDMGAQGAAGGSDGADSGSQGASGGSGGTTGEGSQGTSGQGGSGN